ncbi:MAG: flippase-like domain-containing protein [Actinomycetota bacterium]|nr:flippase-like domain-containing protein [Actinomycetota bacterium]
MHSFTQALLSLSGPVVYVVVFLLAALECAAFIGFFFPGELTIILGGVIAFQGRVSLPVIAAVAVAGAIAGNMLGYMIGARWGARLLQNRVVRRFAKPKHIEKAQDLLRRRGGTAILIGRFTAVLRVLIPGLAGMTSIPLGTYTLYSVLGAIVWGGGFTLFGYLAGDAWQQVGKIASRASLIVGLMLVFAFVLVVVGRWFSRNEDAVRRWWRRQVKRPHVASIARRYEGQIRFAQARFKPAGAFGLYATLGLAATLLLGWLFALAFGDVIQGQKLALIDGPVARFFGEHHSPWATQFMSLVTHLGGPFFSMGAWLIFGSVAVRSAKNIRPAVYLFACVAGGYLIELSIRLLVHRTPPFAAVVSLFTSSFPSGHTVTAVTLFGGAAFIFSRTSHDWSNRVWAWVVTASVVVIVGISRIYLAAHFASDVIAGAALGATWLAACSTSWVVWDRLGTSEQLRAVRRQVTRQVIKWTLFAFSLGLVVHVILLALPGIRNSAGALKRINPVLIAVALLMEVVSNGALARVYMSALEAVGGKPRYTQMLKVSMAMFSVGHIFPAGSAAAGVFGTRRLTQMGEEPARATTSILMGGVLAMVTLSAIVAIGSLTSLFKGDLPAIYVIAISIVLAFFVAAFIIVLIVIRSATLREKFFDRAEAIPKRMKVKVDVKDWRESFADIAINLPGPRPLLKIMAWSAVNWVLDAGALWVLFIGFGFRLHVGVLLVGYGVANLVTAFPITPGGLGLVEAGMAGTYTALGTPTSIAIVAVLAYRLVSYWLPIIAGIPAYLRGARPSSATIDAPEPLKEPIPSPKEPSFYD